MSIRFPNRLLLDWIWCVPLSRVMNVLAHSGVCCVCACAAGLGSVVFVLLDVSWVLTVTAPGIITLALLRSEMSTSLLSSAPSSNSDSLGSLSHSESLGSGSVADLSGSSFSLSFCACASLECRHFIRRFWNQTLTWNIREKDSLEKQEHFMYVYFYLLLNCAFVW